MQGATESSVLGKTESPVRHSVRDDVKVVVKVWNSWERDMGWKETAAVSAQTEYKAMSLE